MLQDKDQLTIPKLKIHNIWHVPLFHWTPQYKISNSNRLVGMNNLKTLYTMKVYYVTHYFRPKMRSKPSARTFKIKLFLNTLPVLSKKDNLF